MGIYGLSAADALELLRRHCMTHDLTLGVLAAQLLAVQQQRSVSIAPSHAVNSLLEDVTHLPDHDPVQQESCYLSRIASA